MITESQRTYANWYKYYVQLMRLVAPLVHRSYQNTDEFEDDFDQDQIMVFNGLKTAIKNNSQICWNSSMTIQMTLIDLYQAIRDPSNMLLLTIVVSQRELDDLGS
jgi:hypothetical protein